jgi:hypothetical protein
MVTVMTIGILNMALLKSCQPFPFLGVLFDYKRCAAGERMKKDFPCPSVSPSLLLLLMIKSPSSCSFLLFRDPAPDPRD